jgi:hypothetical protein
VQHSDLGKAFGGGYRSDAARRDERYLLALIDGYPSGN